MNPGASIAWVESEHVIVGTMQVDAGYRWDPATMLGVHLGSATSIREFAPLDLGLSVHVGFDGPAYVACRTGAPIVPIGLGNTEASMPKGVKFIRPVKMTIVVGEPLYPPPPKASGRVSRKAVRDLTVQLGERIQELFDEAQALAGHPNPPHLEPEPVEVVDELPPEAVDGPADDRGDRPSA